MSKLIITENVKIISFKIDGSPVVVNQEYDLSLQDTIEIENTFGFPSEPLDFFRYKIKDGDILSTNEGLVRISYKVDTSTLPLEYNLIQALNINESFVFSDLVPGSNNYDRIKINSITGKGLWLLDGIPVEAGQVLFYYQVYNNLTFVASDPGSKPNYNSFKWQFGHKLAFWSHENSIDVDVTSLAEINLANPIQVPEQVDTIDIVEYEVNLLNGPESGTFKIEINTAGFTGIGVAPQNRVIVSINGIPTIYSTSGLFPLTGTLDQGGNRNIEVTLERAYPYTTASSISIDLKEVNSLTDTINPAKDNIALNNPISITP